MVDVGEDNENRCAVKEQAPSIEPSLHINQAITAVICHLATNRNTAEVETERPTANGRRVRKMGMLTS